MKVKIDDYLSEYEITEICKEALRDSIMASYGRECEVQRLLVNLSYDIVVNLVNEVMNGEMMETVKQKTREVIEGLSTYTVFRNKDIFDKEDSVAWKILQEESNNARPLIKKRIEDIINDYDFHELKQDEISYTIAEVIREQLFTAKEY